MLVSTKGRYALRVMVDLAEHQAAGRIPLKEIAARQGISEKYLENILATLVRANMLSGMRGKGGGYVLTRPPEQYTVGEILRLTEGSLAPVACLDGDCKGCSLPPTRATTTSSSPTCHLGTGQKCWIFLPSEARQMIRPPIVAMDGLL